ncbi:hypothetical protein, conserved [Eimeria brunetti]|uniref:Uncharacterized protein n=1 Tax=Eimeria brunetti TaxID=51314 RepID=U6LZJ2_9EIME|nr:hypothetical protein, conserved [Eimeria brunetti]
MSSRSHLWEDPPLQSLSHVIAPSTVSVSPYKLSRHPYAAQWSDSLFGKRIPSRQRKYLTLLSCAFVVAIVFGGYFCRLKGRSWNRAALTTRRLAGGGEADDLRRLEEAFAAGLCQVVDASADSAPPATTAGEASVSTGSVEAQRVGRGGKKRLFQDYWTDLLLEPGAPRARPYQEGDGKKEVRKHIQKKARLAEWGMDPVADLELLLDTSQSVPQSEHTAGEQQSPFTAGSESLIASLMDALPLEDPTLGADPTAYQLANTAEGLLSNMGSVSSAYIPQEASGKLPAVGGSPDSEPLSSIFGRSLKAVAGNGLSPVARGHFQTADSTVDDTWLQHSDTTGALGQAFSPLPQNLVQAPDNGAGFSSPSTASFSGPQTQQLFQAPDNGTGFASPSTASFTGSPAQQLLQAPDIGSGFASPSAASFSGYQPQQLFQAPDNVSGFASPSAASFSSYQPQQLFQAPDNVSGFANPSAASFSGPQPQQLFQAPDNVSGFASPSTASFSGPRTQQQFQAPDNGTGSASPSTAFFSDYGLQRTVRSSAQRLGGDIGEERARSLVNMTQWDDNEMAFASTSEDELQKHRQYRLPRVMPGVRIGYLSWERALRCSGISRQVPLKLLEFQKLMRKDELSQAEVNNMLALTWDLLKFAASAKRSQVVKRSVCDVVAPLSIRFLVLDALWSACEILGDQSEKQLWWDKVAQELTAPPVLLQHPKLTAPSRYEPFLRRLRAAFSAFRSGNRPSARDVLTIKKMMFGPPTIHGTFAGVVWDFWRRDLG